MGEIDRGPVTAADAAAARLFLAGIKDVKYFSAPRTLKGERFYVMNIDGANTHGRKILDAVHSAGFICRNISFENTGGYYRVTISERA